MNRDKIIVIGAINEGRAATCGETAKNQIFISRFRELFSTVITVDTLNWKRRPWVLVKILFVLLFNRGAKVIISASRAASYLIAFLHYVPLKKSVYFWAIGGDLHIAVSKGIFKIGHLKSLRYILVEGENMKSELNKYGLDNVKVVPNAKPIIYTPEITKKGDSDTFRFVFLSRVHPHKGIKEIYEATKILNAKGYGERFIVDIYGKIEESFTTTFNSYIDELPNLSYKGFLNLTQQDGYKTLASYDIMLFPTYWGGEGFPGVVIDANMAGLPIVATDWNMNREVIKDGITGYLIPPHDSATLASCMERFILRDIDLYTMKRACAEHVKNYDYRNVVSKELVCNIGLME